jgi:GxxExxY protein
LCGITFEDRRIFRIDRLRALKNLPSLESPQQPKLDFVCYGDVIVEVKATSITGPADHAQVLNYLAISGHHTALLLNFGRRSLEHQRFVMGATD